MPINKSTYFVLILVLIITTLSVTVFKSEKSSGQRPLQVPTARSVEDDLKRYPTAEYDEPEPSDTSKKLVSKQRQKRNNDSVFAKPGPRDEEVAFPPEADFNFPAFPLNVSDTIVVAQVLNGSAHRSENKANVFSDFEVRVDEILKARNSALAAGEIITLERVGGFLRYPSGRKVLFRLVGHGMPEVGARYVFFLNTVDQDYRIVTGYELSVTGVVIPLDNSAQFRSHQGEDETNFLNALRKAIKDTLPQQE